MKGREQIFNKILIFHNRFKLIQPILSEMVIYKESQNDVYITLRLTTERYAKAMGHMLIQKNGSILGQSSNCCSVLSSHRFLLEQDNNLKIYDIFKQFDIEKIFDYIQDTYISFRRTFCQNKSNYGLNGLKKYSNIDMEAKTLRNVTTL